MVLILSLLVIVMSSLYIGAKRKAKRLTKKTEELSNVVHLETWGVPSNLYSDVYKTENIASVVPVDNINTKVEEQNPIYVEDCMDDAALAFLSSLEVTASSVDNKQNMRSEDESEEMYEVMKMYEAVENFNYEEEQFFDAVRGELDNTIVKNNITITEDILLSAADWELPVTEHNIPLQYRDLADSSIADETLGLQTWVCKVIGNEDYYLHITDNTAQTWLNAEIYQGFKKFNVGDVLFVEICRNSDNTLTLQSISCLEKCSSDNLYLEDELMLNNHSEEYTEWKNEAI